MQGQTIWVDTDKCCFSQLTIKLEKGHIQILKELKNKKQWNSEYAIDVLDCQDGRYISLDNRRLFLAFVAGIQSIQVRIRNPNSVLDVNDIVNTRMRSQYKQRIVIQKLLDKVQTWRDLLNFRMFMQQGFNKLSKKAKKGQIILPTGQGWQQFKKISDTSEQLFKVLLEHANLKEINSQYPNIDLSQIEITDEEAQFLSQDQNFGFNQ